MQKVHLKSYLPSTPAPQQHPGWSREHHQSPLTHSTMASTATEQAIDDLINEMSSAADAQPQGEPAHNWILHSDVSLPASNQLTPLVDAIRRIADVQDGLAATLDAQGEQMRKIAETQGKLVKDLAEMREGTTALDAQAHLESETASKHPDTTVRILSASVRHLQTNQAQICTDLATVMGKATQNGKEKQKENEKPDGADKMDVDIPTCPKPRSLALALRPHVHENARPQQVPTEPKKASAKAPEKTDKVGGDREIPGPIQQTLTNINSRYQNLEGLRKRDYFALKGHLLAVGQRERMNVVNHLRSSAKVEVLQQQMAAVLGALGDVTELPREVVHKFRNCVAACQDLENKMVYWRQRLQRATTVGDDRLENSVNTAIGELRRARDGSPGPPHQPNTEGIDLLISVGEWMLQSYAGILRVGQDGGPNASPSTPPTFFQARKRPVEEEDEYYGRLKRRPAEESPRGRNLGPERAPFRESFRGDFYTPRAPKALPVRGELFDANKSARGTFERAGGRDDGRIKREE
ncbi:uncharacterized protein BDZ99DRAFT_474167 [Mytilinidion resinicola]|uniref:Uncharacterized protein n=1 Tax=Mytilinidion resinicola TaxID=574789 RepID=A0A6A6YZX7_9PEZI|nr:uncharacterized protein BDZ99DRAFT_474167 [Mytilinidion resinicola]KAF2813527.1 hypothetical protein BDZ99DRAFT_474167 [Mytilinidion resinicola]